MSTLSSASTLSLDAFIERTCDRLPAGEPVQYGPAAGAASGSTSSSPLGSASGSFCSVTARTLRIAVAGGVFIKPGAAIAYRGTLTFRRLRTLTAPSLLGAVLRETAPLVRAEGRGWLYCGSHGEHVELVQLTGNAIDVAWSDLLAFEDTLQFEPALVGRGVGVAAGGLVRIRLSGHGTFALATHGRPVALLVTPDQPVSTDPHATLAWTTTVMPRLKTDLTWRSLLAHGGHEPVQMLFEGQGAVLVQPFEDASRVSWKPTPLKRLASLLG